MIDPATSRSQAPMGREEVSTTSEAHINSFLDGLRDVKVPSGLNDRVESRLNAAKLPGGDPMTSHWPSAWIAASILVVGFASIGLVTHRSGAVHPVAPLPAVFGHTPSSGMDAASAIRVPTRALEQGILTEGRTGHPSGSGRQTVARHIVLPRGVAVPHHPMTESTVNRNDAATPPQDLARH